MKASYNSDSTKTSFRVFYSDGIIICYQLLVAFILQVEKMVLYSEISL